MKQVTAFQTDDGKMFDDKLKALEHQLSLDVRGIINTGREKGQEAHVAIARAEDNLYTKLQKYRRQRAGLLKSAK